eukprot:7535019-Alexandrium_andersonii.AAC.1
MPSWRSPLPEQALCVDSLAGHLGADCHVQAMRCAAIGVASIPAKPSLGTRRLAEVPRGFPVGSRTA